MKDRIELSDVVLLGRTFDEYCRFFQLSDIELRQGSTLDLGAGVSSFCAEARSRGHTVLAADPIYCLPTDTIAVKSEEDLNNVVRQIPDVLHKYNWTFYKTPTDLARHRETARLLFLGDYERHKDRYLDTSLPETSFRNAQFSLVLVSHFLFLYDDLFNYEFHKKSILEAVRISSREVRLYPLVNMRAEKSIFVERLLRDTECSGCIFQIIESDFEFCKNANELLIVRKSLANLSEGTR
jgi:hypothetical protein